MGSADPPMAVHRLHGDRHRQHRRPGAGGRDASALGDLLAASPARLAPAHGFVLVRAAVWRQVAELAACRLKAAEAGGATRLLTRRRFWHFLFSTCESSR